LLVLHVFWPRYLINDLRFYFPWTTC